jgi:hypothetical protein
MAKPSELSSESTGIFFLILEGDASLLLPSILPSSSLLVALPLRFFPAAGLRGVEVLLGGPNVEGPFLLPVNPHFFMMPQCR